MFGAPVSHRAVGPAVVALLTAAVAVPGTVDAQEAAPETETYWLSLDHIQGNWVRVESNNPSNDGMRIRVEGDRATITAMPPRGSSRFHVGQVVWQDLSTFDSGSGSLEVRGSDGAYYLSEMTITEITGVRGQATRLAIDVDKENSPGNDQTWAYAGPSIDGDWVLVDGGNQGLRVRVDGDRATIRYVPGTAGRELRVGDLLWRNIGSGDRGDLAGYQGRLEALSGGRSYRPAIYDTYRDNRIIIYLDSERGQYWYRPEDAEKQMAAADEEDEDEGAILDLPRETVGDPSAPEENLESSDDLPNADTREDPADDPTTATVQGTVSDAAGTPLPQVSVLAISGTSGYEAITGADGTYSLDVAITEPEALVTFVFDLLGEDGTATGDRQFTSLTLRPGQSTTLNQTFEGTDRGDTPADDESTAGLTTAAFDAGGHDPFEAPAGYTAPAGLFGYGSQ